MSDQGSADGAAVGVLEPGAPSFISYDPAGGGEVATFPETSAEQVRAVVGEARQAFAWWSGLTWAEREQRLRKWAGAITRGLDDLCELIHRENGKPRGDAVLEAVLAIDHIGWAAGHARRCCARGGSARPADGQQRRDGGVPAARRGRRDRPVELPGVHPDGVDRLRPGRRQRRGVQAERVHPGHRRGGWSTPGRAPSPTRRTSVQLVTGWATPAPRCAGRGRQDRLHRLGADRPQGDGRLRREAGAGAHGVRRQGRADRGRRRRPGCRRRRRAVGRDVATAGRPASASSGSTSPTRSTTVRRPAAPSSATSSAGSGRRGRLGPIDHAVARST